MIMFSSACGLRGYLLLAGGLLAAVISCARVDGSVPAAAHGSPPPAATDAAADRAGPLPDAAQADRGPPKPGCVNLQCQQVSCPGGATTSISGTVFAPNGKLPLYNVVVYVPNAALEPFPAGLTCDRCGAVASGKPIVTALSDAEGKFRLTNVPAGANIPLVFQVGKWRRRVTITNVTACQDNPLADPSITRLPRNRMEGDIPRIAVTTGSCDQLGCLLPKLGLDAAELGAASEDKAVAYYQTSGGQVSSSPGRIGPANMRPATELWNDEAQLSKYDLTLLSCECSENLTNKSAMAFAAMTNYMGKGGRIFGSHYSYVWLKHTPDPDLSAAVAIGNPGPGASPLKIDTSFPKGKALADWMKFLDPSSAHGEVTSREVFNNVRSVMAPSALAWASSQTLSGDPRAGVAAGPNIPRIITVNTPAGVPVEKQCGRAAHLDAHIALFDTAMVPTNAVFPESCGPSLSKGEEALAFLFFDLASCIRDETTPIEPPIVVP
jgi:hypothetical protein